MKYIEKECPQCNGELYVQDADGNSSLCDLCNGSGVLGWLFEDKRVSSKLITINVSQKHIDNKTISIFKVSGLWGIGTVGNHCGKVLSETMANELIDNSVRCFILDLSNLDYEWSDSIFGFYNMFIKKNKKYNFSVVANEKDKKALNILNAMSGERIKLTGIFDDFSEALNSLYSL
ncbi:hypothetical protein [Pseudobacteroides cellulosolvens]|uniref:STAS domain-containing protein n=1 Tax=Pseudobacteroides cellulosolvens ATCC 35603 = DSM 2933 TaxID=398512 RepID=A0A0L6JJF8_9FIRM|nr:hypothetical protein [Pseudobacteroides cellulosolvens]KNY25870.1 hypothetical protein Bccel_1130 [Pseudobacteroides cellulosolvens ATCC 35603 = DSM 2933]